MKKEFSCHMCEVLKQTGMTTKSSVFEVVIGDKSVYDVTCKEGHRSLVLYRNASFELIFEAGLHALKDDYYREAVFNFATALERFYEFSIQFFLYDIIKPDKNAEISEKGYEKYQTLWKSIVSQSERQVGAFYSLFLHEFNEGAPVFNNRWLKENKKSEIRRQGKNMETIEFRNKIIHQGMSPTKDEAILYGDAVHYYIYEQLNLYLDKDEKRVLDLVNISSYIDYKPYEGMGIFQTTYFNSCFISINPPSCVRNYRSIVDFL